LVERLTSEFLSPQRNDLARYPEIVERTSGLIRRFVARADSEQEQGGWSKLSPS
jgi:hypothetical protein